jgi:hypothetical protein
MANVTQNSRGSTNPTKAFPHHPLSLNLEHLMAPTRTDKCSNKKPTKKGGRANAGTASMEKENNSTSASANPTGDHGSRHQTNLEQELAELKGKDVNRVNFIPLPLMFDMSTVRLEKETAARKAAEKKLKAKKAPRNVPKPQGCFGDNYSIQEQMGLSDNKQLYKTILVSVRVCVII